MNNMILSSEEALQFLTDIGVYAQFASIVSPTPIAAYFNTRKLHDTTSFNVIAEENDFYALAETNSVKSVTQGALLSTEDDVYTYNWKLEKTPEPLSNGFTKLTLRKISMVAK